MLGHRSPTDDYTDHEEDLSLLDVCRTGKLLRRPAARMLYGVPVNANQRRQENVEMALM